MIINRRLLFWMSTITIVFFSIIGIAIIVGLQHRSLYHLLLTTAWQQQLLYGTIYGTAIALIAISLIETDYLKPVTHFFQNLFQKSKLSYIDIIFASICAGIGEELFFRGAIQYYLDIWITALLFVAMHGYLNPNNIRISIYGCLMVLMSAGLGYLTLYTGLLSAMVAHTVFDIIMFRHLIKEVERSE